jgi:hypothetical protein
MDKKKMLYWIVGVAVVIGVIYLVNQSRVRTSETLDYSWKPTDTGNTITEGQAY